MVSVKEGEDELAYFMILDDEFNKVEQFYRSDLEELRREGDTPKKQTDAFIAFRNKVEIPTLEMTPALASHVPSDTAALPTSTPRGTILNRSVSIVREAMDEESSQHEEQSNDSNDSKLEAIVSKTVDEEITEHEEQSDDSSDSELEELKTINTKLEEVIKLIEWVKTTIIEHFTNSNHRKGMSMLRPNAKTERHAITFIMGFLAGCTISVLLALILIALSRKIDKQQGTIQYMETLFRLDSLFGFMVLHILTFAAGLYFWGLSRVNYSFIFGFKKGQELGYREVLLLGFSIAPFAILCVLANLDMQVDPNTQDYNALTELLPPILLLILIVVLLWPFDVYSRPNRVFFLRCLFRCICAPFYKVTFADSFLADQFTSQVQALRSLVFYICYYGWGDFKRRQCNCEGNTIFIIFSFLVAAIPYWIRFLQCLQRRFEKKDTRQGYNALKYFITIAAVCLRTAYAYYGGKGLQVLAWISSVAATIFSSYWDLVIDWGLLQRHSKNPWLRDKLIIPHENVYFVAIFLNVLLRFAWLQTILNLKFSFFHGEAVITLLASLEIIRRGIWNFFKLENEHLNNVAHCRAFKREKLPFNYDEDNSKDIEEG